MYPPSYQGGIAHEILDNPYKKLIGLRFSYGYQFDLLKKIGFKGSLLDYGCGAANFIVNSNQYGFNSNGAEYNPEHVQILKRELPLNSFYTVEELLNTDAKFDLIRLSNVFEHFTEPKTEMLALKNKLNSKGYFLIEGPIECNFNFALQFRKLYFTLRKIINPKFLANHTPTHIIFSNSKNQKAFFKELGLTKIHWETSEAEWPFPHNFKEAKGITSKLNVIIARISISLKRLNKNWGNTFIYLGQVE
jgi:2-polyprenyl-3-methyl-5-hydroxy-6-metoxy-1,4-benzoquinol methylase